MDLGLAELGFPVKCQEKKMWCGGGGAGEWVKGGGGVTA